MDSLWERRQATRQRLGTGENPAGATGELDDAGGVSPNCTVRVGSPAPTTDSDPHGHLAAVVDSLTRTATLDQELDVLLAPSAHAPRTRITKAAGSTEILVRLAEETTGTSSSVAADLANALRGFR